jgi:hypothetical protein
MRTCFRRWKAGPDSWLTQVVGQNAGIPGGFSVFGSRNGEKQAVKPQFRFVRLFLMLLNQLATDLKA